MSVKRQFVVFVAVGVATTVVDVWSLAGMLRLNLASGVATTFAFALALVTNYCGHALFTFRAMFTHGSMLRFGVIVLLNYLITMLCVTASKFSLDSVMIGKFASIPVMTAISFLSGRYWIFR